MSGYAAPMNKLPLGDSELGEAEIEGLVSSHPVSSHRQNRDVFSRIKGRALAKPSTTTKGPKRFLIPGFICLTLVTFMVSHISNEKVSTPTGVPTDMTNYDYYEGKSDDYLDDKDVISEDDTYGESIYARHEKPGTDGKGDNNKHEKKNTGNNNHGKNNGGKSSKSPTVKENHAEYTNDSDESGDHKEEKESVDGEESQDDNDEKENQVESDEIDDNNEETEISTGEEDTQDGDDETENQVKSDETNVAIEEKESPTGGEDNQDDTQDDTGEIDITVSTDNEDYSDSKDSKEEIDSEEDDNSSRGDDDTDFGDDYESHEETDDVTDGHDETGDQSETFEDEENITFDKESEVEEMIEQWGKWHFWDGDPDSRPKVDFLAEYPNRDCPYDDFPDGSWQADAVYVNHLLDSAAELVLRAKEAIYTEYGWGPRENLDTPQLIERSKMFRMTRVDFTEEDVEEPSEAMDRGGWTTKRTFQSLSRRLLHAMMTNDEFTVVLGGHSAAAGHGNHFHQSYMMQFHKILDPIFKRMGVKLVTKNLAQGGLGTLHSSLGSKSIYGDKVDMIVWDSSMTEQGSDAIDLFARQALIGGKVPPIIWGGHFSVLKDLYINAGVDVMQHGSGMYGIPTTYSDEQVETLPWATRYMQCPEDDRELCERQENRFRTKCWIERDDVIPPTEQRDHSSSQVKWHPGFRIHQLKGRVLVVSILDALQDALATWSDVTIYAGHPLQDEYWHMTDIYDEMQSKVRDIKPGVGSCSSFDGTIPERVCRTPLQGRTEFTPRSNPNTTSITGILKPTNDGYIPKLEESMLYDGPDVENPALMVPHGEVDVLAIVSNRRRLGEIPDLYSFWHVPQSIDDSNEKKENKSKYLRRRGESNEIILGKGWEVDGNPGNCDGTATGICGRLKSSDCLLSGHMDARGGILGNELSGWLVMNLDNLSEGILILKMETWHQPDENTITEDWEDVNNGEYRRKLKPEVPVQPDDFIFEYAIDGDVTSLSKDEFYELRGEPERNVELFTLLDDKSFAEDEPKDVEFAFRMRNCGHTCSFKMTHVYWG